MNELHQKCEKLALQMSCLRKEKAVLLEEEIITQLNDMSEDYMIERTKAVAAEMPVIGFYLQERAYHPQLPWILNKSDVSWVPVITGDDSWRPFQLSGRECVRMRSYNQPEASGKGSGCSSQQSDCHRGGL